MFKDRKVYKSKLEGQLAQWKAELEVLKDKTRRTGVDLIVRCDQSMFG